MKIYADSSVLPGRVLLYDSTAEGGTPAVPIKVDVEFGITGISDIHVGKDIQNRLPFFALIGLTAALIFFAVKNA